MQMQKSFFKVADFIQWQKSGTLLLAPEFQRRNVWRAGAKSYLIDTIVRNLPIPIIFLRDKQTDPTSFVSMREVIDGQQRLRTVLSFVAPDLLRDFNPERDAFTVKKTHNSEIAGKSFKELPADIKRLILDYEFSVHVLPSNIDDRDIIQIFRRMNATNYSLTPQEKRNAHYFGEFKSCVYTLAAEQLHRWRKWSVFSEDDIARMVEVEFTSECVSSFVEGKICGKSGARLDKVYENYDDVFSVRGEAERRFRHVLDQIETNFKSDDSDFVFFKKTLVYTLIMIIYDLTIGLTVDLKKKCKLGALTAVQVKAIKLASEQIKNRKAHEDVLAATDRRTTNPKERKHLFDYIRRLTNHA